jgi:hypothetical protein
MWYLKTFYSYHHSSQFFFCVYEIYLHHIFLLHVGQDSVVGTMTHYGLDGLGIKSQWGQDFLHPSRLALGPTQPYTMGTGSLLEVKGLACGTDHPPPFSAKVKERVELYIYSSSSWAFTFTFSVTCFYHNEHPHGGFTCRPPWRWLIREMCFKCWRIRVGKISPWNRTFLENLKLPSWSKTSLPCMESQVSVPCSQKPTTDYYLNPTNWPQVLTSCLLVTHFKNILPSTSRFSLKFVTKILCIYIYIYIYIMSIPCPPI